MSQHLLIAGYGFLGEELESVFAAAGWQVSKLNRSGRGGADPCDLTQADQLARMTAQLPAIDYVTHCASTRGGGAEAYREIYHRAARNLRDTLPDAQHIIVSSTSVYAQKDHSAVDENSPAEPMTETGKILRETEEETLAAGGTVARLSGLYGPDRCHILRKFRTGDARLDGAGERIMNFIHRSDAAAALMTLAEQNPANIAAEIYNITANPTSQRDCYAALAEHFSLPMPGAADTDAPRKRGNTSKCVSNHKIKSLGWEPQMADFLSLCLACE